MTRFASEGLTLHQAQQNDLISACEQGNLAEAQVFYPHQFPLRRCSYAVHAVPSPALCVFLVIHSPDHCFDSQAVLALGDADVNGVEAVRFCRAPALIHTCTHDAHMQLIMMSNKHGVQTHTDHLKVTSGGSQRGAELR